MSICKGKNGEGCENKKRAHFGLDGKATHCGGCKTPEMYNPHGKCIVCKKVTAHYGLDGKRTHCGGCKSDEMDSTGGKCIVCKETRASYGLDGKRTHCGGCMSDEMYNPQHINGGKIEDNKKGCTRCGQMKDFSEYNNTAKCLQCRTTARQYKNNRYKNNENFRIETKLRSQMNRVLNGKLKAKSTKKLLGSTIEEFVEWLNYQLKIKYNTEEKDPDIEYDIDHFIPCASFDLVEKEEQEKCFHWTNLQYLISKENKKKTDKLPSKKEINERQQMISNFK